MLRLRRQQFGILLCGVFTLACGGAVVPEPKAPISPPRGFEVLAEISLDGVLVGATDVRWDEAATLLVSDLGNGLNRLDWSGGEPVASSVSPATGRFHRWIRLAHSSPYRAGSFVAFHVWWTGPEGASGEYLIEYPADIDLHGNRLLVAGLRRDEAGTVAGDGYIAWLGELGDELVPLLPSADGVGAPRMMSCASLDLPRVRFLPDGRSVVVPGTEPGIFLYDPAGQLERTWETQSLGINTGCPLTEDQVSRLGTDEQARVEWRNRRRLVDEIVPRPGGFGLLVRSRTDGTTRWELLDLSFEGSVGRTALPVMSSSPWPHLRADVRNDRAAFLVMSPTATPPANTTDRLLILSWPSSESLGR